MITQEEYVAAKVAAGFNPDGTETALAKQTVLDAAIVEKLVTEGDLSKFTPKERVEYYNSMCQSLGLNPLTRPFEYLVLDSKMVLYARKDATEQLRVQRNVSVTIVSRERQGDVFLVTARATLPSGRQDESIGAVPLMKEDGEWKTAPSGKRYFASNGKLIPLSPDALANAYMKAETKAKRRVTLSICGVGFLDESELDTVKGARHLDVTPAGEIVPPAPAPKSAPPPAADTRAADEDFLEEFHSLMEMVPNDVGNQITATVLKYAGAPGGLSTLAVEKRSAFLDRIKTKIKAHLDMNGGPK